MALFSDRFDAGKKLARHLSAYKNRADVVVLALPRGGVPVAYEVAAAVNAPLDVFLVRKLGVPGHEELAMGAIASNGVVVLNQEVVQALNIPHHIIDEVAGREKVELHRREQAYRDDRPPADVEGKIAILIDDGLATGASMRAAVEALWPHRPAKLVVAVPVAAAETCREFQELVDQVVCLDTPQPFHGVGMWYEDFSQTSDDMVRSLLQEAARQQSRQP